MRAALPVAVAMLSQSEIEIMLYTCQFDFYSHALYENRIETGSHGK